jgi:hypothetical protein
MITYGQYQFEKDMRDVIALCGSWWKDSLFYKTYGIDYDVDIDFFRSLYKTGYLFYTCGRDDDNVLISCYVGVKQPYLFNKNLLSAHEIVWCIDKPHRNFKNLVGLLKAIEDLMSNNKIIIWNLNVSNESVYNNTGEFLNRKGYTFMDKIYSKIKQEKNNG